MPFKYGSSSQCVLIYGLMVLYHTYLLWNWHRLELDKLEYMRQCLSLSKSWFEWDNVQPAKRNKFWGAGKSERLCRAELHKNRTWLLQDSAFRGRCGLSGQLPTWDWSGDSWSSGLGFYLWKRQSRKSCWWSATQANSLWSLLSWLDCCAQFWMFLPPNSLKQCVCGFWCLCTDTSLSIREWTDTSLRHQGVNCLLGFGFDQCCPVEPSHHPEGQNNILPGRL